MNVQVPDEHHLFNFIIEGEGVNLIVLDDYGDDWLPNVIRERMFGMEYGQYTLAIDRKTGELGLLTLEDCDGEPAFWFQEWMPPSLDRRESYRIPRRWVKRLDELLHMKRPFQCHIHPHTLQEFINQDVGYDRLRQEVVFTLGFVNASIEVWGENYRKVPGWQIVPEPRKRKGAP